MTTPKRFFAAANGYTGFRSYFDSVFCSEDYDKIYVIKGGPGTGKSSLMKKLSAYFSERDVNIENIYCSSDPDSLDGVIFEKNGKRAAIIDGTAPHERDAVIPGAIDELINLGDNWEAKWLKAQRQKILELTKEKKNAYKAAYSYLKIAGAANAEIAELTAKACDRKLLKLLINSLAEINASIKSTAFHTRLISSFGKCGEVKFDTLDSENYRHFSVIGDKEAGYIFINELIKSYASNYSRIIRFPCPFDDKKSEAVLFCDTGVCFDVYGKGEKISTVDFLSENKINTEQIKAMKFMENESMTQAERWFNIASQMHFRLEEIYSQSMFFTKNDIILEEKKTELSELFDI